MLLSILVMTVPNRRRTFMQDILDSLERQVGSNKDVEILCLYDNKMRTVGDKRTALLSIAKGDYIAFVDDDDMVSNDYIGEVLHTLRTEPTTDVLVFDVEYKNGGSPPHLCRHGLEYENGLVKDVFYRKPAHIHVWKRNIVKDVPFLPVSNGEDMDWTKRVSQLVKVQTRIEKVLYYYNFNTNTTETQK